MRGEIRHLRNYKLERQDMGRTKTFENLEIVILDNSNSKEVSGRQKRQRRPQRRRRKMRRR